MKASQLTKCNWLAVFAALIAVASNAEFQRPNFRLSRANKQQTSQTPSTTTTTTTTSISTAELQRQQQLTSEAATNAPAVLQRNARDSQAFTANGGYNILVTNTCDLESMTVNVKTSKPFYGVIHTKNEPRHSFCSINGDGSTEYTLNISFALRPDDPKYCGVVSARRESRDDKNVVYTVLAIRSAPKIELSDDRFVMLNCTHRCSRADCSSESKSASLRNAEDIEREESPKRAVDKCSIYDFPVFVGLMWCMAIMIISLLIFNCLVCSNFHCRWVKREIEDRDESVYEETDYSSDDNNTRQVARNKHNKPNNNNTKSSHAASNRQMQQQQQGFKSSSGKPIKHQISYNNHNHNDHNDDDDCQDNNYNSYVKKSSNAKSRAAHQQR